MKKIIGFIRDYLNETDARILLVSVAFTAIGIYSNYHFGVDQQLNEKSSAIKFINWYLIFFVAFSFTYILAALLLHLNIFQNKKFIFLLCIAPFVFAVKMAAPVHLFISGNAVVNNYWNAVIYFPLKLLVVLFCLLILWRLFNRDQPFYGWQKSSFSIKPYWLMLLIMLPFIAVASTQPDFLRMYPKMHHIAFLRTSGKTIYKVLYELSYGTDFISIELFFRGFLIFAFSRWAGQHSILPMAIFYCTIHFGKPLGECISSFFGGILLGIISYRTGTIRGGLIIHLGIAWMMELGGYLGNQLLS